jgi:hypothetical protein
LTKYTGVVTRRVTRPGRKERARGRPQPLGGGTPREDGAPPSVPARLAAPMSGPGCRPGEAGRGEVRHGRCGAIV